MSTLNKEQQAIMVGYWETDNGNSIGFRDGYSLSVKAETKQLRGA